MKALVLAAGKGTRLHGVSGDVPKPLVEIGGITPLRHALAWVAEFGAERIWINVHAHAALITRAIGAAVAGVPVAYSYEPELLGTAGAWHKLQDEWQDTSLVVYGDNLMRFDLHALLAAHRAYGAIATIAVYDATRHRNTGIGGGRVELDGPRVTKFIEGGTAGLINAGAYFVEPELRAWLEPGFADFGRDVLPALAAAEQLCGHVVEAGAYCLGIDTPERLQIARELLATQELSV